MCTTLNLPLIHVADCHIHVKLEILKKFTSESGENEFSKNNIIPLKILSCTDK